jgi:hypothetical protein
MSILSRIDLFDAVGAIQGFPSRDDFWIALARVSVDADHYLRDYNASVVLYDDDTKRAFLKELEDIRDILISLRVKDAPQLLNDLAEAVARMDTASLIDGLRVFHAEMVILKVSLHAALISTG